MNIQFGDLLFTTDDGGRLLLEKCYFIDNQSKSTNVKMTPVFDVAGGSNSGEVNQKSTDTLSMLRYASHTVDDSVLTVVQACEGIEVTSKYERFSNTNAIRMTQSVKNTGDAPFTLEVLQSLNLTFGTDVFEHLDFYLHRFTNFRYTESMPDVRSLYDLGLYFKNGAYRFLNIGPASSVEYVPQGILENRASGDFMMFEIEAYTDWYAEIACTYADGFTLMLGGPNARYHGWCRPLAAGESYTSVPVTLCAGKSVNGVLAEMTRYRRHIKPVSAADASLPVIYNEYMHYSWDDPYAVRALETAPTVADVGANYYIIDCGWHNSKAADNTTVMYKLFGTWYEDQSRFPDGIKAVADAMHAHGMKFGLWLAPEVVGCDATERVSIALDFFDASINRVSAWVTGFRSMQKALLSALCMPHALLKELQDQNQLSRKMAVMEDIKLLPLGDVWAEYCRVCAVPADSWYDEIEEYEKTVLLKRV